MINLNLLRTKKFYEFKIKTNVEYVLNLIISGKTIVKNTKLVRRELCLLLSLL